MIRENIFTTIHLKYFSGKYVSEIFAENTEKQFDKTDFKVHVSMKVKIC